MKRYYGLYTNNGHASGAHHHKMNKLDKIKIPFSSRLSLPKKDKPGGGLNERNKFKVPFYVRLSIKEQAHFAKRLSFLIRAGVPIAESLRIMRRQTKSKSKGKIFEKIIHDVSSGMFLATSLERLEHIFGNFAVNIIRIGESSGILDQNLEHLANELKKRRELQQKVFSALVYPIFITIATVGLTGVLTVYIFPKIRPIFESMNVNLPLSTKILIWTSDFLSKYGLFVILGIIFASILTAILVKRVKPIRLAAHRFILKIPITGPIALGYNMTNFCRTLGLLLKGDVKIMEAVAITRNSTVNEVYRKEMLKVIEGVSKGEKVSKHLERRPDIFPDLMTQMIAIGESTGNLSDTLLYLADMYETEVDDMTKNLSSSIEPVLMIFMGFLVGFMAVSVITPIYEITKSLQR